MPNQKRELFVTIKAQIDGAIQSGKKEVNLDLRAKRLDNQDATKLVALLTQYENNDLKINLNLGNNPGPIYGDYNRFDDLGALMLLECKRVAKINLYNSCCLQERGIDRLVRLTQEINRNRSSIYRKELILFGNDEAAAWNYIREVRTRRHPARSVLDLDKAPIGGKVLFQMLMDGLSRNKYFTSIKVTAPQYDLRTSTLIETLLARDVLLEEITLAKCSELVSETPHEIHLLAELIEKNHSTLKTLNLSETLQCHLLDLEIHTDSFARALSKCTSLETLDLSGTYIRMTPVLRNAINQCRSLKTFEVAGSWLASARSQIHVGSHSNNSSNSSSSSSYPTDSEDDDDRASWENTDNPSESEQYIYEDDEDDDESNSSPLNRAFLPEPIYQRSRPQDKPPTSQNTWELPPIAIIPRHRLVGEEKIGTGNYGNVYKTTLDGTFIAEKRFFLQKTDEKTEEIFQNESRILFALRHRHILPFRGITKVPRALLMELMHCSLHSIIHNNTTDIPHSTNLRFAHEISTALLYLHECGVIHFDLKPENILLTENHEVKVSDFGLAKVKQLSASISNVQGRGTVTYMAPELLDANSGKVSFKVDIYSFGVILWELMSRQKPLDNMNLMQIAIFIGTGKRPPVSRTWNKELTALMRGCWDQDPNNRPTAGEATNYLMTLRYPTPPAFSPPPPTVPSVLPSAPFVSRSSQGTGSAVMSIRVNRR